MIVCLFVLAIFATQRSLNVSRQPGSKAVSPSAEPDTNTLMVDYSLIDRSENPCNDFYRYACGKWLDRTEIPPDLSRYARSFTSINERNLATLKNILENYRAGNFTPNSRAAAKLGDYYESCMNEEEVEKHGPVLLQQELEGLNAIGQSSDLAKPLSQMHLKAIDGFFSFDNEPDRHDSKNVIGLADVGSLGLPNRHYYTKSDDKFKNIRNEYVRHVAKMMVLAGSSAQEAQEAAQFILAFETSLAESMLTPEDRRDPKNIDNPMSFEGFEALIPNFDWKSYFASIGIEAYVLSGKKLNVTEPAFFKKLNQLLKETPFEQLKTYLKWNVLRKLAASLGQSFFDEHFHFYMTVLTGQKEKRPRWKYCITVLGDLEKFGEPLGEAFVNHSFGEVGKASAKALTANVREAMSSNLKTVDWMDDPTRTTALQKLEKISEKIGYPDTWTDYGSVNIQRNAFGMNNLQANVFHKKKNLMEIGKPTDRTKWFMTAHQVNAYYEQSLNEIAFPAGILQAPAFSAKANSSENYGAIGVVIGHEITHGFDDKGRLFDADGNQKDWWSPGVNEIFKKKAQCIEDEYNQFIAVDDLHLSGKLTLGENIADLGGVKMAYNAFQKDKAGQDLSKVKVSSDNQEFFLSFGQFWCSKDTPESMRDRVVRDPHSLPKYRVNGVLVNVKAFAEAFGCKPGDKMVSNSPCVVW